jgi:hypothetical protein
VAKYAGEHMHHRIVAHDSFKGGNYRQSLIDVFLSVDAEMHEGTDGWDGTGG